MISRIFKCILKIHLIEPPPSSTSPTHLIEPPSPSPHSMDAFFDGVGGGGVAVVGWAAVDVVVGVVLVVGKYDRDKEEMTINCNFEDLLNGG